MNIEPLNLWIQIGSLLHQGANGKPKAVGQREIIFAAQQLRLLKAIAVDIIANMRIHIAVEAVMAAHTLAEV